MNRENLIKKQLGIFILIVGFSGMVAQMLLLRELLIVFSGNELSIGIILANWLILEAIGSFFAGRNIEKSKNKIAVFTGITILFSLFLPASIYLTRILKNIIGVSIGESVGFLPMLYSSFLILLPASVLHGALFTYSCKVYSMFFTRDVSSVGKVYVYEIVGTIIGGIVWTYFLILYFHSFQTAIGLAMLNFLALLILSYRNFKKFRQPFSFRFLSLTAIFIFSGYLLVGGGADKLHQRSINEQWAGHNLVHYQNSIYGNISVIESGEQYIFLLDGIPTIITPIPDILFVEGFVHIPMLAHPDPKRLLILGGGAGGIINEILKHPQVERLDYAELDPLLIELIRKFSTPLTEKELTAQRVHIKHIDGRLFLKTTENKYDLIMVGTLNPSNLRINRFFTKEFFSLAKERLDEDGILVMGLPGSLDYLSEEIKNLNSCIFNTLKSVFTYVRVLPGEGTNLFLSSNSQEISRIDKMKFINRSAERKINGEVLIPRHIEKKLHPGWQGWISEFLEGGTRKINRDFNPLGLFYSISHWNALFSPYLRNLFRWFGKINLQMFFGMFIIFVVLFFLIQSKTKIRLFTSGIPFSISTTGFSGMIFELALIFAFQSIFGYVFSWIGLLIAFFMAGVGGGAIIITSYLSRIKNELKFFKNTELAIIFFSFGLALLFFLTPSHLIQPELFVFLRILFLVISFIAGFLVGVQFLLANKIYLKDEAKLSRTAGFLYAADLFGGWIGGVTGGVILLPVLGLFGTCVVVGLLKLSSFIIISYQARA